MLPRPGPPRASSPAPGQPRTASGAILPALAVRFLPDPTHLIYLALFSLLKNRPGRVREPAAAAAHGIR